MAMQWPIKSRLELKREIDRLNRVRAVLGLEIISMRSQPGYLGGDDFAETANTLIGVEDELRDLARQYDA
jgi:hypothetical protein